ncbi:MAG: SH3-like domain-containing protein [Phaeodactylibacter sp.]|nr:SH3-like domain-containing protein [Phaeodactylibacter sp.]MCB9050006.1 SH3-like domain-containing protein [Lewinellaceae bacterium]
MKLKHLNIVLILLIGLLAASCNSKPRVIESESSAGQADEAGMNGLPGEPLVSDAVPKEHKVTVEEALNTERYTYLFVSEEGEQFWIAIPRSEVKKGEVCYFRGGIMKKDFFSQEFNRVFETVYLVSEFWKEPSGGGLEGAHANLQGGGAIPDLEVKNLKRAEGAIKLSELFSNKEKYNNRMIKVTGKCVKVNPRIMNRNWVHLRDGSGEGLDLTVTTMEDIPLGATVTMEGIIALDKDFGAGYRYDLIMEDAVLQ